MYCLPFLVCTVLAHFFTFTITFVPLSSNWHRHYCGHMIWLLAHPLPARCVYFLTDGGGWVNLLNNGAANKKIFKKVKCCQQLAAHPLIGRPSLNNWAGVSGKRNKFNTRWRLNTETNGHWSPQSQANIYHLPLSRSPFFLITHYL